MADFAREKNGQRFKPGSINTVKPLDQLAEGEYGYLQNVRGYLQDRITGRTLESDPIALGSNFILNLYIVGSSSAWTSPANLTSPTLYTSAQVTFSSGTGSLIATIGPQTIPVGATVTGIQVTAVAYNTANSTIVTFTPSIAGTFGQSFTAQVGPSGYTLGGKNDSWGATLTPALINPGFTFDVEGHHIGLTSNQFLFLNSMAVTIYYSTPPVAIVTANPIHSVRRLNDSTPAGPGVGYSYIIGSDNNVYCNSAFVADGMSGNPLSLAPFRPNASPEPWMYVGDSSQGVTLAASGFRCAGMIKVRSDGTTFKTGIAEPLTAPTVTTQATTSSGTDNLPATTIPWTNVGGANPSFNYSHSSAGDGTAPVIIATPIFGSTITLNVTGTATVNGVAHNPGDAGPSSSTYPGNFVTSPNIVLGAFTDAGGNVVASGGPVKIGASTVLIVPAGATQLQVGIDSSANTFSANSGQFSIAWQVTTAAIATKVSTLGQVTAYVWGDSPHSGPVATYIWRNPNDVGTGIPRTVGTAANTVTNNSWQFDSAPEDGTVPVQWDSLLSDGTVSGSVPLFTPALESEGYQDFNCAVVGTLFIPAPGTYVFTIKNKDQVMMGVGGGATVSGGFVTGPRGQTTSVVNSLPLVYVSAINGTGGAITQNVSISFPGAGSYQVELDWDYWFHTGRSLIMTVNGAVIPPLPVGVRTNVEYACKYRSSLTGAVSNPGPASSPQVTPVLSNTISCAFSPDPQVDKVDYYRQDDGLANFTYVATGPNTNPPTAIVDSLSDLAAANNQIMARDDFEPFPSIDLPKAGRVNVTGGVITWVSGDQFNIRWLPGTIILIGSPTQLAYSFTTRPTSATSIPLPGVPDGTNLAYNIAEPLLAAQPLPSMWGPTDNTAYLFACGDPLRPGTLYYTKGNNPDSAPDTNQIEVTSPSEPLINGVIVNGIGMVFSSERAWLIYPTFTTALATVNGVSGQAFNLVESITNRGLYIRPAICTEAGKIVFFRAKDGIYASMGGSGSKSITDSQIFNLFPHEGFVPQPITIGAYTTSSPPSVFVGYTIYPPDDTQPEMQKLSFSTGYLYYDYVNTLGDPCTLVWEAATGGWSVDIYADPVTVHALGEGPDINDVVLGTEGGFLRLLSNTGTEIATSVIATGSTNAGDARALKRIGDAFLKAQIKSSNVLTPTLYYDRYLDHISGTTPATFTGNGLLSDYLIDFSSGQGSDVVDIALTLSWPTTPQTVVELWQPNFLPLAPTVQDHPSDWDDCGLAGNKYIQGLILELNTFNQAKTFSIQRSDDYAIFTPVECPVTVNGQGMRSFSFNPPFLAHMVRRVSVDGVPWQAGPDEGWKLRWLAQPYPEASTIWRTEGTSNGANGYQHAFQINLAYISSVPVTFTMITDQGTVVGPTFPPTSGSALLPIKTLAKLPRNKWKTISYQLTGSQPFYVWKNLTEVWVKTWGSEDEYAKYAPFGTTTTIGGAEV